MDIYWIKDKRKCGPAPVPDVISLIQMGELSPDDKGWHSGVKGWQPLRELPALVDFLGGFQPTEPAPAPAQTATEPMAAPAPGNAATPPPLPATPPPLPATAQGTVRMNLNLNKHAAAGVDPSQVEIAAPWMRLLARLMDTALYMTLGMGLLYLAGATYDSLMSPFGHTAFLFWLPMILLEAVMLHKRGTTLGKKLFGISIATFGPVQNLPLGTAVRRSLFVFILGMGMMFSIFPAVAMFISYMLLRSNGLCWWDARALTLPVCVRKPGAKQIVITLSGLYAMLLLWGVFMQPWIGPMYNEILKVSPEYAKLMEPLMQKANVDIPADKP